MNWFISRFCLLIPYPMGTGHRHSSLHPGLPSFSYRKVFSDVLNPRVRCVKQERAHSGLRSGFDPFLHSIQSRNRPESGSLPVEGARVWMCDVRVRAYLFIGSLTEHSEEREVEATKGVAFLFESCLNLDARIKEGKRSESNWGLGINYRERRFDFAGME